jgi:hypothetical protein
VKNRIFRIPLLLTMLLASTIVIADEATIHEPKLPIYKSFGLRATTGLMYHKYAGPVYKKFSDNIPFVGIGATINVGHLSLDGYAQRSDKGKDSSFSIGTRGRLTRRPCSTVMIMQSR